MLDKVDLKIIHVLSKDARASHKHIASAVRTSKSTVAYRISKLIESGVIAGFQTIVNPTALGKINARLALSISHINASQYASLIRSLCHEPSLHWLATTQGVAHIATASVLDSMTSFGQTLDFIHQKLGSKLIKQEISVVRDVWFCFPSMGKSEPLPPIHTSYEGPIENFSSFDLQLLHHLQQHPLETTTTMGRHFKCSTHKIVSTKKRLESKKVIERYVPVLNYAKLGYETYHLFWHVANPSPKSVSTLRTYLLQQRNVLHVTRALGPAALECEVIVPNQRALYQWVEKVKQHSKIDIHGYEYLLFYKIHKNQLYL